MRGLRWISAAILAALVLTFAACGDDEEGSETETPAVSSSPEDSNEGGDRIVVNGDGNGFSAQAVYEAAGPGVVTVRSIFEGEGGSLLDGGQAGQGSGFVVSDDGEIATNAHVITDAQASGNGTPEEADEVFVQLPDQNQVPAEVVGFDLFADVALLRIDPEGLELNPIELGEIDSVGIGEPVAAIGSPFGQRQSLSTGIVSATDRSIASLTRFQIDGAIQTDASINPGNSGGPLLDAEARVIGMNQQIDTTSGGNQGVGFAVPVDLVSRSIDQLRENGEVSYAYLGVQTVELYPQLAEELGIDADAGAIVDSVQPDSPAAEAGLEPGDERLRFQGATYRVGGDVIVGIEGEELEAGSDLPVIVNGYDPGDTVTLQVVRDGERDEVEVTFGERPSRLPGSDPAGLDPEDLFPPDE